MGSYFEEISNSRSPVLMSFTEGLLNVDKPAGMTSHDVVDRIRRVGGIRRVGHAGTLDPLATGVLLVCLGRATRLLEFLVGQPKTYLATVRLGQTTDSYDADGRIMLERSFAHVTDIILAEALSRFRGSIKQRPPMVSAVKKEGQPLYKLARKGIITERPWREVTIYRLDLLACDLPFLQLRISCSTGTYVRALAHDLGELLDCGGHVTALRRTAVGDFSDSEAVSLAELNAETVAKHLRSSDVAVSHLPRLDLSESDWERLRNGQSIQKQPSHPEGPLVRIYGPDGPFVGIVTSSNQLWRPRKIFHPELSA